MASTPAPFCSQCGAPLQGSQRFCTNCGMTIETHASSPTLAASQAHFTPPAGGAQPGQPGAPGQVNSSAETAPPPSSLPGPGGSMYPNSNPSLVPPPPPPSLYNPYTNSMPVAPQGYAQTTVPDSYTPPPLVTPPPQAGAYPVPAYAQKQKSNHGCRNTSIVLLLVLALGIGGYFLIHSLVNKNTTGNTTGAQNTPTGSTQGNTNKGSTPTTSANGVTTQQLNLQITYASVNITIISTQLAQSFADDSSTSAGSAGVVRLNLRENNSTAHNSDYVENEVMLLLFPGGTTAQANNEKESVSPDAGVNRQNWIDFQLNSPVTLNQLVLRLGMQNQNQMDIPLQPGADLSKYQDKTSSPNAQFKYGPLNMTLKTAVLSYSYNVTQATTGNRYVIVTLAAVNNTSNSVELYPPAHMRMQAGGNSVQPDNTYTLPIAIDANTSGSGIVAFLVPQDITSFTLVLLAQTSPVIAQVTQNFQIQ